MPFTFVMLPPHTEAARGWAGRLAAALPEMTVRMPENQNEAAAVLAGADGAYGTPSPALVKAAKKLRWLQAPAAAPPAGFYFPELVAHPVTVTNMREIYSDHLGAHIMAFVLAFARGLHYYLPQQFRREWKPRPMDSGTIHLPDATLLVVGMGGIGAETARLATAFGMRVIATDARRTEAPPGVAELHPATALDTLLPRADFVLLTVPHTPATEGMMDRARFRRMKAGAFFINIGRGMTTRFDDLVAALEAGEIAGAALDVFEEEPLPADHPLWTLPNVLITPHMASYGPHLDERRYEVILANCRAMLAGKPLRNVVDKANWF
ncbi:MAG: D-2-hydroxyacid dehydrogenase [Alphaproteobacteria bacterium]|nr:D-2-hydroxyacid dehydrogenase [Alphaproteobacteria bacterium]